MCADKLVVGGGVGWSYDRRRRRAAHFFIGGGGVALLSAAAASAASESSETTHSRVFSGLQGSATSPVISAGR